MILKVNGRRINFWNNFKLNLVFNSIGSTFDFAYRNDVDSNESKFLSQLGEYNDCTLEENGELLLTGTILNHSFVSDSLPDLSTFSGYSKPAVLNDCNVPISIYPLQSDGLSLAQITSKLITPFGLNFAPDNRVREEINKVIEVSNAEPTDTIYGYLSKLASQRNIIVNHDVDGRLIYTRARTDTPPIDNFIDGKRGVKFSLQFNGQALHSEITVLSQADSSGGNSGEFTIKNPYAKSFRPKTIIQTSGDDNDISKTARESLGKELSSIKLTINKDSWFDKNGKILKPNQIITVRNKELRIFDETRFFVESISFEGDSKSQTAVLTCVLPFVYNNDTVINVFS